MTRGLGVVAGAAIISGTLACAGGGDGGTDPAPAPSCVTRPLISAPAVVNGWPGLEPVSTAAELAAGCQALTELEALPWFDRSGLCDEQHPTLCTDSFRTERRALLSAMAAEGVTVYLQTHNSNSKGPWRLSDEWYREHVRAIREDVDATGVDAWLGAPSEPWAHDFDAGLRRARIAREEWPGTFVLADAGSNRALGRPYFEGIPYDWLEVHPCKLEDAFAAVRFDGPILTVTDCTPILNPGPILGAELAAEALLFGSPLIVYDHFAVALDGSLVDAVGDVLRARQ